MSSKEQAQVKASPAPARSFSSTHTGLLQRKCACGGTPGLDGECASCRRKRLAGQGGLSIQPKLAVNQPGDRYEQEADRVAEAVMRVPAPLVQRRIEPGIIQAKPLIDKIFPVIQRQVENEEEGVEGASAEVRLPQPIKEKKDEQMIQAKPIADHLRPLIQCRPELEEGGETLQARLMAGEPSATALAQGEAKDGTPLDETEDVAELDFQAQLDTEKSGGHRLGPPVRQFMEARFGVDFGQVRVHANERSADLAAAVHAQAFTVGNDIYFGAGYYDPESTVGRQLLAHELVHTLQQNPGHLRQKAAQGEVGTDTGVIPVMAAPLIQRVQAFVPRTRPSGTKIHSDVLPAFGEANPDLFTEVKIPGAKKFVIEEGKAGIADFYMNHTTDPLKSPTTIAVNLEGGEPKYLEPDKKLRRGKDKWTTQHEKEGAPIGPKPGSKGCNGGTGTERVCRLDKAPGTILLGDLKPGASAESILGEGQLSDYMGGLRNTSTSINTYIHTNPTLAHPKSTYWLPSSHTIPMLTIPPQYDFATATTPMEPLGLYVPGRKTADIIPGLVGRMIVYKDQDVGGVWVYEWVPTSISPSLKKGAISKEFKDAVSRVEALIKRLQTAPTGPTPKRLSKQKARRRNDGGLQAKGHHAAASVRPAAPRVIQRKKEEFDHRAWQTDYKEWSKQTEKVLESDKGRDPKVMAALVEVKERSRLPIDVPQSFTQVARQLSKLEHWVRWGGVYGRLRRVFGSLFTKVSDLYTKAREKFRALTKRKPPTSSGDSLTKTIIRVAFRTAQGFFSLTIHRVVERLKTALEKGAEVLVNEFFGEENVEKLTSAKADLEKMVADLQEAAEQRVDAIIEEMVKPYEKELSFIADVSKWVGDIGKIVNTVRWVARAINCATPPGVGCLKILLQAAGEAALEKVVESCWFQKNIFQPLFEKISFFQELPDRISGFIIEQIKKVLPLDESLKAKLFPSTAAPAGKVNEGDIPCDEESLSPEKLAMARLYDQHGEEKIKLLIAMMEKAGIGDKQELSLPQIEQMDRVLNTVSQADIEAAIKNYDRSKAFGIVGMDELAQSIKAAAAGGGAVATAGGGEEGGSVIGADKAKFDGTKVGKLGRTRIKVEKPLWEHVKGSEPLVDLNGYVDRKWVKTVTDVPTRVTKRLWKPDDVSKEYLAPYYKLKQGVRFDHDVPDVPTFVLAEGDEIPGYLKYQPKSSKSAEQKETPATGATP